MKSRDLFRNLISVSLILGLFLTVPCLKYILFEVPFSKEESVFNSPTLFVEGQIKSRVEPPSLALIQDNSLSGISSPHVVSSESRATVTLGDSQSKKRIIEYEINSGDSLWSIAAKFDISLDTLLWANDLNENSVIQPGQELIILPVSGVIHRIEKGDTVSQIAQTYNASTEKILSFNGLSGQADIYIGDVLIVPGGEMPPPPARKASSQVPLGDTYFICPISAPCRITQGLHWYNAVDFSHGQCGEPVYAAAQGEVLKVELTNSRSRWTFEGAGNHLSVLHPNGVVTIYGHIQNSLVEPGQHVSQGEMVALMGGAPGTPGAGMSTGCHLHFGVRGARNPFAP